MGRVARRRAATRRARVPRAPKRRTTWERATRRAARRASVPKAPKRRTTVRRRSKRSARRVTIRRVRKPKIPVGSMRKVWNGTADRTGGGLLKKDLMVNKRGKVVSRKSAAHGKKRFKSSGLGKWVAAMQKARAELGLTGFVACKKGTAYSKLSKTYYGN